MRRGRQTGMTAIAAGVMLAALAAAGFGLARPAAAESRQLTVYAYDSFISIAKKTTPEFEKLCGCKLLVRGTGDAGQVLSRAILEKEDPQADVVVGIDNSYLSKALEHGILEPYRPAAADTIPAELILDPEFRLTPFEYGYLAFVYDTQKIKEPPRTFEDLLRPEYKEKIILEDPRTSGPGMAFLVWTVAVYGDPGYLDFWRRLKPNILTISRGWDSAYGMFMNGEAPMVLSYATSPAYHVEHEKTTRYRAFVPAEGGFRQIEGVGLLEGAKNTDLGKKYIDFMLSKAFQSRIPLSQWVFPVNREVELPASFSYAARADKFVSLAPGVLAGKREAWLKAWITLMTR